MWTSDCGVRPGRFRTLPGPCPPANRAAGLRAKQGPPALVSLLGKGLGGFGHPIFGKKCSLEAAKAYPLKESVGNMHFGWYESGGHSPYQHSGSMSGASNFCSYVGATATKARGSIDFCS